MADRMTQRGLLMLAASIGTAATLSAQNPGEIRGVVTDALSGAPLAGVVVTIVGSDLIATTDGEGAYALPVPPGLIKVSAQVIGFVPITTPYYSVRPDSTVAVDFRLAPISVALDPVEVTGQRGQRSEVGIGAQVLTPEQLPKRGNILDALTGVVPGLSTTGRRDDTAVRARGSMRQVLYVVNGVVITPPLTFYIDASEVECVEVRRGYHAAAEFRHSLSGETYSGVILIWTTGSNAPKPGSCFERS